ncbi:hypothetical protein AMTR_s00131p00018340 [Amborella trichopoda]|uniref:Uncharacterized protein n=1 Tax=Amborella trichopoda TaxID=13333 RepID=W1NR04_AMBTC|nr:hypothetical protein AMTR_s00131p00018340 [Amborella trichopoda]
MTKENDEENNVSVFSGNSSRCAQIRLVASNPEVYEPCDDSFAWFDALLTDRANLVELRPNLCMEIGCRDSVHRHRIRFG